MPTEEWIKKTQTRATECDSASKKNETLPFATTWMELESIMLRFSLSLSLGPSLLPLSISLKKKKEKKKEKENDKSKSRLSLNYREQTTYQRESGGMDEIGDGD